MTPFMAIGLLACTGNIPDTHLKDYLIMGELSGWTDSTCKRSIAHCYPGKKKVLKLYPAGTKCQRSGNS